MKVFEIKYGTVFKEYPQYNSAEEASKHFSKNIVFVDAPDIVFEGYGYDETKTGDSRFIRPKLSEGWVYDENGNPINIEYTRKVERISLHNGTTNDTLQALRKIREGDTSYDWEGWLAILDAYNVAIEDTVNQEGYPLKVEYPEYPSRPPKE